MNAISRIYTGTVRHRRFRPAENQFQYGIFLMYLDLDELPHLLDPYRCWSVERANLACWRRRHYLGPRDLPLADAVRYRVREQCGIELDGPIRILTHLQYFGYCYNPATFYYCFDAAGESVVVNIVEIMNTPWGERHAYILGPHQNEATGPRKRYRFEKDFHVSPFMPMDIRYDWRFTAPGDRLNVHMISEHPEGRIFDATLALTAAPVTAGNLNRVLWRYPFMTGKVITLIHWQALKLWSKRVPFIKHPAKRPPDQKDPYEKLPETTP